MNSEEKSPFYGLLDTKLDWLLNRGLRSILLNDRIWKGHGLPWRFRVRGLEDLSNLLKVELDESRIS